MANIYMNGAVFDSYKRGNNLNDAITEVFGDEIKNRISENPVFAKFSPLELVMHDAGFNKNSSVGEIMNAATVSGGVDVNQWLFPAWVETTLREKMYETNWLPYVVTTNISVDGNTVQSATLDLTSDENKKSIKKARIAEGADIPTGKIRINSKAITLWKRGRALEMTYEAVRRMKIDLFKVHLNAVASDVASQELEAAIDVIVNGDGNANGALEIGKTANANAITADDIVDALIEYSFVNHFNADTLIVPKKYLKSMSNLTYDTQLASGISNRLTLNIPQINFSNLEVIGTENLSDKFVLSNRANTLIRYQENGSNIQEMANHIRNQTELMTLTENSGYAINVMGSNMYMEIKNS